MLAPSKHAVNFLFRPKKVELNGPHCRCTRVRYLASPTINSSSEIKSNFFGKPAGIGRQKGHQNSLKIVRARITVVVAVTARAGAFCGFWGVPVCAVNPQETQEILKSCVVGGTGLEPVTSAL